MSLCVRTPNPSVEWLCWGKSPPMNLCLSLQGPSPPTPTQKALTEILEWLENHPQEVVILVCRNFKGMMETQYLMGCIENILGDMLCPRGVTGATGSPCSW